MQPKDSLNVGNELQNCVLAYYKSSQRDAICFQKTRNEEWGGTYLHFLLDRTYVIRYAFSLDRGMWVGGLELGIGPAYFAPAYFWSYENSTRFANDLDEQSVFLNLRLLDEFLNRDKPLYVVK